MPNLSPRRPRLLRGFATMALGFAFLTVAAPDASAQLGQRLEEHNRRFYGPDYQGRGYADRLGLTGHKRCENGGYYGPPQLYSRQYGRVAGYRLVPPFAPLRNFQKTGEPVEGY